MFDNQFVVVVGLGASGISSIKFLTAHNVNFMVMDTRPSPPSLESLKKTYPSLNIVTGGLDSNYLSKADVIVLSPGISVKNELIQREKARGAKIIGDIELFALVVNAPVIAITGTNAKSTVTTVVAHMAEAESLSVKVGGNLGTPALDLLANQVDVYVLELSSFQLETTYSLQPKVATVLNVTPDHMDRYVDITDYQEAKLRVYQNCEWQVCNKEDPLTESNAYPTQKKLKFTEGVPQKNEFGLMTKVGKTYLAFENQCLMETNQLPVKGKHYQINALASLALGYAFGLKIETMLSVLKTFPGLPHRCQFVRELNGIKWFNDSKGTNVGATLAAIKGLGPEIEGKLVIIAGGLGKNADFTPLLPAFLQYSRHIVLIGEAAQELASMLEKKVSHSFAPNMEEAVKEANRQAKKGDSVLLSPACASFDMFKHFEHRGDVFMDEVCKLI